MPTKNEDLIARVREALDILNDPEQPDARELHINLYNDVLSALEAPVTNGKITPSQRNSLMFALGAPGHKPSEADVLADAKARMDANPLACIADATVKGDRATFTVKDALSQVDEYGFHVAHDVGYGSVQAIAKVIMLHVTRVFGVTASRMEESDSREGGFYVEFNRELTADEADALDTFLGKV